jgi:UV DNA damage endonuclease
MPTYSKSVIRLCKFDLGLRSATFAPERAWPISLPPSLPLDRCFFVTMAPKRKKPTMALMQQDLPTIEERSPPPITPGIANQPPRRSRRNVKSSSGMDGYPIGEKENTKSVNGHKDVKQEKSPGRAQVNSAMHDLQEMEDTFRKSAKRQKLAVKSSAVMNKKHDGNPADPGNAFMPDMRQTSSALSDDDTLEFRRKEQFKKNGQDPEVPHMEQDAAVGEGETGQGVDPEDVNDLKEEGARPPPVNSDYLPLPWKGRLGYVSSHDAGNGAQC